MFGLAWPVYGQSFCTPNIVAISKGGQPARESQLQMHLPLCPLSLSNSGWLCLQELSPNWFSAAANEAQNDRLTEPGNFVALSLAANGGTTA